jgi:hypothetical protein
MLLGGIKDARGVRYEARHSRDLTAFSCPLTIEIRFYIASSAADR